MLTSTPAQRCCAAVLMGVLAGCSRPGPRIVEPPSRCAAPPVAEVDAWRAAVVELRGEAFVVADGRPLGIDPWIAGCALRRDGGVECTDRIHGAGSIPSHEILARVPLDEPAIQLAIPRWGGHACALGRSGRVSCWGDNRAGAVGVAPLASTPPRTRVGGLGDVVDAECGRGHAAEVPEPLPVVRRRREG